MKKIGFQIEPEPVVKNANEVAFETMNSTKTKRTLRQVAVKIGAEFQEYWI